MIHPPLILGRNWDPGFWPRGDSTIPLEGLYYVLFAFALCFAAIWLYRRIRYLITHRGPMRLVTAIGRELGLRPAEMLLLYRIARHEHLPSPITLLASASTLDHYTEKYLASKSSHTRGAIRRQIASIRRQLFEDVQPDTT